MVRQELSVAGQSQSVLSTSPRRVPFGLGRHTTPGVSSPEGNTEPSPSQRTGVKQQRVVWIANEGGHPYSKAESFGRLMPLTKGNVNYFNLDRLMVSIAPKMQSVHEDDYLLVSGSPVVVGLIMSMWLTRFDHCNILQWSQSRGEYIEIVLQREAVDKHSLNGRKVS